MACKARECSAELETYVLLGGAATDLVGDALLLGLLMLFVGAAFVGDVGRDALLKGLGMVSDLTGLILRENRLPCFFVGLVSPREEVRTPVSGAPSLVGDTLREY